jgi:chorismate-pyruvate lyase
LFKESVDSSLQHPELPEALLKSKGQSVIAGVAFDWCASSEVAEPAQGLLVHDRDMTSALEHFHDDRIALEVLQAKQDQDTYFREVILRAVGSGAPVEYGLIEIELSAFGSPLRTAIVEGEQPLGGLLNEAGLAYRSAPLGFFRVPAADLENVFPETPGGTILYGRYNQLIAADGTRLARIIEILPAPTSS